MTGAMSLIKELEQSGVILSRSGDQLVLDGPENVVTDSLVHKVRAFKSDILLCLESWSAKDCRAFFNERAASAEQNGGLPRAEAEARAYKCCMIEWMNRHAESSNSRHCAWCGRQDRPGHTVVPFGTDASGHAWLHFECWENWHRDRQERAHAALLAMGIAKCE